MTTPTNPTATNNPARYVVTVRETITRQITIDANDESEIYTAIDNVTDPDWETVCAAGEVIESDRNVLNVAPEPRRGATPAEIAEIGRYREIVDAVDDCGVGESISIDGFRGLLQTLATRPDVRGVFEYCLNGLVDSIRDDWWGAPATDAEPVTVDELETDDEPAPGDG